MPTIVSSSRCPGSTPGANACLERIATQALRIHGECRDPFGRDRIGNRALPGEGRGELRQGRRCLNAAASLAGTPEKAGDRALVPNRRVAIGGKGAQARPAAVHARDLDVECALDAIDRACDREVLGIGIARD